MKQCKICNKFKELSEFGENRILPDGVQPMCRECVKIKQGEFISTNHPKTVKLNKCCPIKR